MGSDWIARNPRAWIVTACLAACCCMLPARAHAGAVAAAAAAAAAAGDGAAEAGAEIRDVSSAPELRDSISWLFPLSQAAAVDAKPSNSIELVHLANSRLSSTEPQLHDLFFAPDWHPGSH